MGYKCIKRVNIKNVEENKNIELVAALGVYHSIEYSRESENSNSDLMELQIVCIS